MGNSFLTATATAAVASLVTFGAVQGQAPAVNEQPAWLKESLEVWAGQDSAAAFAHLEASGEAEVVAQRYAALAQHLYNDRRDLPGMILAVRAGIQFNLERARQLDSADKMAADKHRGHAKAMAYNLGANCWPGWMEKGITITATDRAIGLDAARLNLRLAVELGRPAEPLGHAHWLLGAQLLAAEQFDGAAAQFASSARQFAEAKKPTEQQMAVSYESLTRSLQQTGDSGRRESLKQSLEALESLGNDDARFFADQIRTAEKAFAR